MPATSLKKVRQSEQMLRDEFNPYRKQLFTRKQSEAIHGR